MKKVLIASTIAATAFLINAPAWAVYQVTEKIRSIDPAVHQVRLADGLYYDFNRDVSLNGFKPGDEVAIVVHQYNDNGGLWCPAESITKVR
jgi:hypothetical protein